MTGVDSIAQKLDAIINVRIDSEQILSLLGILVMKKSTIKNSWMAEMGLYNPGVFSSAPDFLLGSRERKCWGGRISKYLRVNIH